MGKSPQATEEGSPFMNDELPGRTDRQAQYLRDTLAAPRKARERFPDDTVARRQLEAELSFDADINHRLPDLPEPLRRRLHQARSDMAGRRDELLGLRVREQITDGRFRARLQSIIDLFTADCAAILDDDQYLKFCGTHKGVRQALPERGR
jgi:hypothetical protein